MKAAIIGVTGYGGIELLRLLSNHPAIDIHSIHTSSQTGMRLSEVYPHVTNLVELSLEEIDIAKLANEVDVVFLSTPSGISTTIVPELLKENVRIIDLSGDYRLKNTSEYEQWYKKTAAIQEHLNKATYGLPEWHMKDIQNSRFISNPGCYPTATVLGLAPLVKNKLIDEKSIVIDAKSGVSGAGKSPTRTTHFAESNDNFSIYKVNQHQHIPEIEQVLRSWDESIPYVTFSTHLVPMTRGIMSTIYSNSAVDSLTLDQLYELYKESYQDAPFVRIREKGTFPSTKEVYGTNYCDIGLAIDKRTNRITVVSVIDNLVKGAAGQAIQNANIMFGIEENTGLNYVPLFP
ncbi:N-acetyl-gamma-glutamyl-phosphate reductase [Bacillus sinesaloumensis]|uniref:N-acetyl-gamma-glutamyl-phosphate reductase n=1 Tax=Litchfieldia sinesaloumensis TaxID=1926280 RepID=UPI0009884341|nr:N-acetyl-gamma-glutamyl-phosphate reductase [Bacillus sinesaloumensis]